MTPVIASRMDTASSNRNVQLYHVVLVTCLLMSSIWSSSGAEYPLGGFVYEESTPNFYDTQMFGNGITAPEFYSGNANADVYSTHGNAEFYSSNTNPEFYNVNANPGEFYSDNANPKYYDINANPEFYNDNVAPEFYSEGIYNDNPEADGQMVISAASQPQQFVQTRGQQFWLNGKPLFVNGANLYYLMTLGSDPNRRYLVTQILKESASVGVTVVRAWAFADGDGTWNLQMRPGVYSESTFRGLDFAIAEAKKVGIRLILSLVNNYPDYGGRSKYVAWAKQYANNWNAKLDDFYSDGTMRQWFKNHIKKVLTRVNTITKVAYRDDPTIFSWELINEPRCESDQSGNKLQTWIQEMASYVKSLDRKHMLEVGMEGFYSSRVNPNSVSSESANPASYVNQFGTDFIRHGQSSNIDFTTVHSYPDSWVPNQSEAQKRAFMASWIKTHINDAKYRLRKPVLFAEYGRSDRAPGYNPRNRFDDMNNIFNAVYASASTGGPAAGALVWQLAPQALKNNIQDGYAIVLSENPSIADLMRKQSSRMSRL